MECQDSIYLSGNTKGHVGVGKKKFENYYRCTQESIHKSNASINGWIDNENMFLLHKGKYFSCEEKWNDEIHGLLDRAVNNKSEWNN